MWKGVITREARDLLFASEYVSPSLLKQTAGPSTALRPFSE